MKILKHLKKLLLFYAGISLLMILVISCSDDDNENSRPTGSIHVDPYHQLSDNNLVVQKVTVGQDSWLVAVNLENGDTDHFIAQPVKVQAGTTSNVKLIFDDDVVTNDPVGQQILLKLYADNQNSGTTGEWDASDEPIKNSRDVLVTKIITVFVYNPFAHYDTNDNGSLDVQEVSETYPDNFTDFWDTDGDGFLSKEEFYSTTLKNTDIDMDEHVSEDEWSDGYTSMYSNWAEDSFSMFDESQNAFLNVDEWNQIFSESQWFETYDADNDTNVTEEEWDTGVFGDWDTDDDGQIDEDEFYKYWPHAQKWLESIIW